MYYVFKDFLGLFRCGMNDTPNISPIEQFVIDFVRKLRDERDVTQEEIGNIIGVTQTYIANIESSKSRAKYNLKHIDLLADHFGLSPKDFLPGKSLVDSSVKEW